MSQVTQSMKMESFLKHHRKEIIDEWVRRLRSQTGSKYAERPIEELIETVTGAYDGNCRVLLYGDYSQIDNFIDKITRLRLDAGFSLSQVQMAFELFREIVMSMFFHSFPPDRFLEAIVKAKKAIRKDVGA